MRYRTPVAVLVLLAGFAPGADFPDAKHKGGELRHVSGVPVLTVRGTPAEIGEQFGVLAVKNAPDLDGLRKRFLTEVGFGKTELLVNAMAARLKPGVPADHLAEMEAACRAADRDFIQMLFANTTYDLSSGMGCSTVVVETGRSSANGPLLGRNFDWLPTKGIHDHTLVAVFRPTGKRAFAVVTVSPIVGCISGMNDAGLACTLNEIHIHQSKDKAPFNWDGTPTMLAFRRVLEECKTVAEAESLLRGMKRTTAASLTICDPSGGAVFEITPKTLVVRPPANGLTCCTNHFCSDELCIPGKPCKRLPKLLAVQAADEKLSVGDVFATLDAVNQGKFTLQSMVFEPSARALHLKLADGTGAPATKRPTAVRLDLGKLFE